MAANAEIFMQGGNIVIVTLKRKSSILRPDNCVDENTALRIHSVFVQGDLQGP